DLKGLSCLHVTANDLSGTLGLEIKQNLLQPYPKLFKRTFDLLGAILGGLAISPLLFAIAVLIKLDSKGSAFYSQPRLGRRGRFFMAYKFRTMHGDGEARLAEMLRSNPAMKIEYEQFHKLTDDPRITRVGRWLRKFSLDELPQLWNVINGDMTLI